MIFCSYVEELSCADVEEEYRSMALLGQFFQDKIFQIKPKMNCMIRVYKTTEVMEMLAKHYFVFILFSNRYLKIPSWIPLLASWLVFKQKLLGQSSLCFFLSINLRLLTYESFLSSICDFIRKTPQEHDWNLSSSVFLASQENERLLGLKAKLRFDLKRKFTLWTSLWKPTGMRGTGQGTLCPANFHTLASKKSFVKKQRDI